MFTDGVSDTDGADKERFGGREAPELNKTGSPGPGAKTKGGPPQARAGNRPGGGAGGAAFTLPDAMIDPIMTRLKTEDPAKSKELEKLRKDNPTEFKTKLQAYLRSKMGQKGGRRPAGAQGAPGGGAGRTGRQGQGAPGGGARGNRQGQGGGGAGAGGGGRPRNN